MKISNVYVGGWFQRTMLQLSEIYDFLRDCKTQLNLQPKKLNEFHKRFLRAETETEKNAVRAELDSFLRKDFERKIEHSKKRIENMKKFVAKLEEEQKNMEAGAQNMIKKRTEEVLQGRIIPVHRKNPAGK